MAVVRLYIAHGGVKVLEGNSLAVAENEFELKE